MAQKPLGLGLCVVCLFLGTQVPPAWAVSTQVNQMLNYRPRMEDVVYTIPSAEEQSQCKVEPVKTAKGTIGWLLVDGRNQPLRRFLDTNGDGKIDIWSYYKDGAEVYRETDTNFNGNPDQYRWFNEGGMKWGLDTNEDGKVDTWRMISAEEAGQEAFLALAAKDFERLRALFLTPLDMQALKLSVTQAERIKGQLAKAPVKFQDTIKRLSLDGRSRFVRVESTPPHCVPGDTLGMDSDLIRFPSRAILYEITGSAEKKHDWIQTGEMIQVGLAWRLCDVPGEEKAPVGPDPNGAGQKYFDLISKIDSEGQVMTARTSAEVNRLMRRVEAIQQLLSVIEPGQRETWIKQMLDSLNSAAQGLYTLPKDVGAQAAMARLTQVKTQLEKDMPGSSLAGYASYRELCATYLPKLADPKIANPNQVQEEWHEKLAKFVQTYPSVEDAPDALHQLGIGSEFSGKDEEAKRWYTQIFTNFPEHHLAAKAKGCVRRLDSIGRELELAGPMLTTGNFSMDQVKGKVVAVYYWASYCQSCPREFAMLKQMQANLAAKGLELVCVNLDDQREEAQKFLQANPLPGIHLFQEAKTGGGLNSPYATQYGINGLPTLFLVGRDGRVINRTLQVLDLDDAIRKAL